MNERIRELAKQAGDYVNEVYTPPVRSKTPGKIWENGHIGWNEQFQAKFAELIVRECLAIARHREDELEDAGLLKESNAAGIVAYRIARQFGVKE
jgi:hypothetical protein